jgi:hypothetical protein
MPARILIIAGLVSAGLLLILLTTTTPSSAGAIGILSVFVLSYIVTLSVVTYVLWSAGILINRIGKRTHLIRKPSILTFKKAYYFSTIIALGPVIVVSLQSVGGVGLYELVLITIFITLGCLYVSRRAR